MSTVTEIEKALEALPLQDAKKISDWLQEYLDARWDARIDEDITAGRFEKLAEQALEDYRAGRVKPLDEIIDHT